MSNKKAHQPQITFIEQNAPVDEYGRALYAITRSILRALLDSLSEEDLRDLNTPLDRVNMRQLAKVVRLDRDKGMRGDGFEWAIHEAILGGEKSVIDPIADAMRKASPKLRDAVPTSLLFGHERAKYLGFLDAIIDDAGSEAYLLPEGQGRPFAFGPWITKAALGVSGEHQLAERIKKIWKTDLFLSIEGERRYLAATIKSNTKLLEGGRGLRIGIVPESPDFGINQGVRYSQKHELWLVTLADPNGFMGLFNDAYHAIGRAVCTLGKQQAPTYWIKPSAKAQRVQLQLEKYSNAPVLEVEDALNNAAQQDLVTTAERLVNVNAPNWLHRNGS
jgi:hypothetical protein